MLLWHEVHLEPVLQQLPVSMPKSLRYSVIIFLFHSVGRFRIMVRRKIQNYVKAKQKQQLISIKVMSLFKVGEGGAQ